MFREDELIDIRRALHKIPELALEEHETQNLLLKKLSQMNQENMVICRIEGLDTALMVKISGTNAKKTIGYRADMDALPVVEETGFDFASRHEGLMHACGHDIHLTVALGLIDYFSENQPKDDLLFFFQPAEEEKNGGKLAYELGAFEGDWRPDEIYALHDNPLLPVGKISCRMGTLFAGTVEVDVDFIGQNGHAAYPHDANDMVVAASAFVMQVQSVIARRIDPLKAAVATFGHLQAGTIRNVITGKARLEGTLRGLEQATLEQLMKHIQRVADGIALGYDCQVHVTFRQGGYLPVENAAKQTKDFISFMEEHHPNQFEITEPAMTGEDFGYLLSKIPGTMFWLGVEDDHPLHSVQFNPKEAAIVPAIEIIADFLTHRMQEKEENNV
ncbi:N-acetyldiaminopimelate deacetylase [Fructobacillus sp. M2-14]|uniref:N-acetyldiaminopimelate deacetylase n=1 Tax=Fructobacillus broussonetiae TaxID=2713173 RepID=A0ABS5QYY5_9LACO|nr:N-acetyldiaminopimelate deacetylase [Fructobacillus broussonetiae]MBS9338182.1 N-acetyldiaminopimelate deacetylase [Fructobacillus broussonetiae]